MATIPLTQRIGRVATRILLHERLRRYFFFRWLYLRLYLLGKAIAERGEVQFFRRVLKPGMHVLDIGANVGFYTFLFASCVGERGKVYAIEPDPFSFGLLKRCLSVSGLSHVHIFQTAVGSREATVTLYASHENRADNRIHSPRRGVGFDTYTVPLTTIDVLAERSGIRRIDGIKMDVQGYEVEVLRGMRDSIEHWKPSWMFIEFAPLDLKDAGSTTSEFWNLLCEAGYAPYAFNDAYEPAPIQHLPSFTERVGDGYTNVLMRRMG